MATLLFSLVDTNWVISFALVLIIVSLIIQSEFQMHLAEMEATRAGMPVVCVNHDGGGGPAVKDIHMENFNISVGGRDLIVDGTVTLSFGRHYGEFSFAPSQLLLSFLREKKETKIELYIHIC